MKKSTIFIIFISFLILAISNVSAYRILYDFENGQTLGTGWTLTTWMGGTISYPTSPAFGTNSLYLASSNNWVDIQYDTGLYPVDGLMNISYKMNIPTLENFQTLLYVVAKGGGGSCGLSNAVFNMAVPTQTNTWTEFSYIVNTSSSTYMRYINGENDYNGTYSGNSVDCIEFSVGGSGFYGWMYIDDIDVHSMTPFMTTTWDGYSPNDGASFTDVDNVAFNYNFAVPYLNRMPVINCSLIVNGERATSEIVGSGTHQLNYSVGSVEKSSNIYNLYCVGTDNEGIVLTNLSSTKTVNICNENWVENVSNCQVNNQVVKVYDDLNSCGVFNRLPQDNGTVLSCDYCTISYTEHNSDCLSNQKSVTYTYNNYETCCALTNETMDCVMPVNHTASCQIIGKYSGTDIPAVAVDTSVEIGMAFIGIIGLVVAVSLFVFYKKYVK